MLLSAQLSESLQSRQHGSSGEDNKTWPDAVTVSNLHGSSLGIAVLGMREQCFIQHWGLTAGVKRTELCRNSLPECKRRLDSGAWNDRFFVKIFSCILLRVSVPVVKLLSLIYCAPLFSETGH